jgi:DNA-directed RNA polymerase specialized sigma24 family protein
VALSDDQKAMLRLLAQREQGYGDIGALMGIGVDDVRAKVKAALDGLDGGLSQDQKAILRMQVQREEGYGDIAALMGIGVDDVRAKVKDALSGLDQEPAAEAEAPEAVPVPPTKADPDPPAAAP